MVSPCLLLVYNGTSIVGWGFRGIFWICWIFQECTCVGRGEVLWTKQKVDMPRASSFLTTFYINRFMSHFLSSIFSISKITFYLMHFSESSHMKGMLPAVRFFLTGKRISFPEFSKLFQTHWNLLLYNIWWNSAFWDVFLDIFQFSSTALTCY